MHSLSQDRKTELDEVEKITAPFQKESSTLKDAAKRIKCVMELQEIDTHCQAVDELGQRIVVAISVVGRYGHPRGYMVYTDSLQPTRYNSQGGTEGLTNPSNRRTGRSPSLPHGDQGPGLYRAEYRSKWHRAICFRGDSGPR